MKNRNKIIFVVGFLLIVLSLSISFVNYFVSLKATKEQIVNQSLPLTIDNVYTEVQKRIVEPYLISSSMSHNTFLKKWLLSKEKDEAEIADYLNEIKSKYHSKYNIYSSFVISTKTNRYYKSFGYYLTLDEKKKRDKWYFDFKNSNKTHQLDLGIDKKDPNKFALYINYKIFDKNGETIGITGISLKVSHIDLMLQELRQKYNFKIYFLNDLGTPILYELSQKPFDNIRENTQLNKYREKIFSKATYSFEYEKDNTTYLLKNKYIPKLDSYLIVEANLDYFVKDVNRLFFFNIFISFLITLAISFIILLSIKRNQNKLEELANLDDLTKISNRKYFYENIFEYKKEALKNKESLNLMFLDIDNFKTINDNLGHDIGDKVLVEFASILNKSSRKNDLVARWGGEEFIIAFFSDTSKDSLSKAEIVRDKINSSKKLKKFVGKKVSASIGLTAIKKEDNIDEALVRVDKAMYHSKSTGKNRVTLF